MRLHCLENWLGEHFDTPILVVRADAASARARFNRAECRQLNALRSEQRRREWTLGRTALKRLLTALGRSADTAGLGFPERQLSLTHASDTAFAAGTPGASRGFGIDYEPLRKVDKRVARWFLNEAETAWLGRQPARERAPHLVRLWTVKEAAFKSHPDNAGITLREFSIASPAAPLTDVSVARTGASIRVATAAYGPGHLSIAINPEPS